MNVIPLDESLFGDMTLDSNLHREMDMMGVDGDDDDDDDDVVFSNDTTLNCSDDDSDDDDDDDDVAKATRPPKSFGQLFMWHWAKRKHRIEHEYAIAGWALGAVCPRRCLKGCPIEDDWGPSICH